MTPDLTWLVWTVALTFVLTMISATGGILQIGLGPLAGNREGLPPATGWAGRARRAPMNMLESLPLVAALILTAHVAGRVNAMVLLGAQLFFWARVAHAAIYIAGIAWIRTVAFFVAVVGMVLIFLQLL